MTAASPHGERLRGVISSRRTIVEAAETYMRAHLDAPLPLSRLCRIIGVSERGLRNAFYGVRGLSPKRCMLAERLQAVRRALIDSRAKPATVTRIATDHGFYQLGRFAATYKEAFGETPSQTLRRNGPKGFPEPGSSQKEHANVCPTS